MKIGGREIGPGQAPYVIAELGVNHDGSVERALELTRAAASAGADAVKLQLFETDRLMSKAAKLAAYQKAAGETDPVAMLRRLEMGIEDMARVVDLAHELGIHAIVTVFSVELVAVAETLGWDAYKAASPDIVHRPLLEELARTGKPMMVSTGASTMEEVGAAAGWLREAGMTGKMALMQCVSSYPTEVAQASLEGIGELWNDFRPVPVGYSDHTAEVETGARAVEAGACILEKHLTHDRAATGPDHAASLKPEQMQKYVRLAKEAKRSVVERVEGAKRVIEVERDVRRVSRQSIVLRMSKRAGEYVRRADITFKRPGTGMLACRVDEVVGRVLTRDVEGDVPVVEGDVKW